MLLTLAAVIFSLFPQASSYCRDARDIFGPCYDGKTTFCDIRCVAAVFYNEILVNVEWATARLFDQQEWHIATREECREEEIRELREMNRAGFYGDPPISLGMSIMWSTNKKNFWDQGAEFESYSEEPCGYADNSIPRNFRTRYTHFVHHNEIDISREAFERAVYRRK